MTEPPSSPEVSHPKDTDRRVRMISDLQAGQGRFRLFGPLWSASRRPAKRNAWSIGTARRQWTS